MRIDPGVVADPVPPTGQFYEPFLKDLELIWRIEYKSSSNSSAAKTRNETLPKHGIKNRQNME
jgi:hypothetical protein